jgi:hypothetical protein
MENAIFILIGALLFTKGLLLVLDELYFKIKCTLNVTGTVIKLDVTNDEGYKSYCPHFRVLIDDREEEIYPKFSNSSIMWNFPVGTKVDFKVDPKDHFCILIYNKFTANMSVFIACSAMIIGVVFTVLGSVIMHGI